MERLNLWPEEADVALPRPPPEPSKGKTPWADLFDGNGVKTVRPLTQYERDPLRFFVDVLGVPRETLLWSRNPGYDTHTWDGTEDPLLATLEAIAAGKWVGVGSGTGTGKTFLAAGILLWFLACFEDALVVTVATGERQLEKGLWREVARLFPRFAARFPTAELTHLRLRVDARRGDNWSAYGLVAAVSAGSESSTVAQGIHAQHLLILLDELPGIPKPIVTAMKNTATGPHNLVVGFGNPDSSLDELAELQALPDVVRIRISSLDHPNVVTGEDLVPGAVSRVSLARREGEYGRDSRLWASRVRGLAPDQSSDGLIQLEWLKAAAALHERLKPAPFDLEQTTRVAAMRAGGRALGVDVANSENGDKAALAYGEGAVLEGVLTQTCPDANALGTQVADQAKAAKLPANRIAVDGTGVGAGTVNELKRLGIRCVNYLGASAPVPDGGRETYTNLRAQRYWRLREDLRLGRVAIAEDKELWKELLAMRWQLRAGKIQIESKDELRKRIGRSPDKADAVCMWNWVRQGVGTIPTAMVAKPTHIAFY